MEAAAAIAPQRAWGRGRLVAKTGGGRTRIAGLYQEGCAKIRLPRTFDASMEAVLINSSGGVTGGDRLAWEFEAGEGTNLTLTTQACEKVYKASVDTAVVATRISVAARGHVDWLPQESILFDRSALSRSLEVDLAPDASFLALEAVLIGRKAMGETVRSGLFRDHWRIRSGGALVHAENLALAGDIAALGSRRAVLDGAVAFATLVYVAPDCEALLPRLRTTLAEHALSGVSHFAVNGRDKIVARVVAADGFALRKILIPLISHLRKGASVPRVWTL
ncbi:urease accessory protein UreD [Sinorhizobium medicae]|uniref:Urease accessory protein UreD n=1 Tax=Sinorhizobium medicae TaxID=110321 RepID=A0A508WVY9_9HYPH|nr:urease accessory protein UreD [Sinorhizobium medicae]MDX0422735.1 urease accessory protein UreD [Sinorhizobium medicae]MDX0522682.1 urease accessory protein UreD [Sinorhizobium medicae]MDX0546447.1 urease accessory protein UreD [Sinorhizobium medicae]MDX0632600.1 urease accessory protein UreD [Sinorhizobium medicae]MDX0714339.1 urease accessory protein UreD [Sinorhizobium medicae]